jgi:hypothetical protein
VRQNGRVNVAGEQKEPIEVDVIQVSTDVIHRAGKLRTLRFLYFSSLKCKL